MSIVPARPRDEKPHRAGPHAAADSPRPHEECARRPATHSWHEDRAPPMTRGRRLILASLILLLAASAGLGRLFAQPAETPEDWQTRQRDVVALLGTSEALSQGLSATIGTAISPLVGIAAISVVGYYRADAEHRGALPWYNQPDFWLWTLLILGLITAKDTVGSVMPLLKKPLDALELLENQISALVALPIVIPTLVQLLEHTSAFAGLRVFDSALTGAAAIFPIAHAAQDLGATGPNPAGLASEAGTGGGPLTWIAVTITTTVVFVVVWFTGHVTNVLVFLNPIPFVDTFLKAARLALIAVIAASPFINPGLGIGVSLVVFVVALWLFGWSFRLTHLGSLMAWDVLTRRSYTANGTEHEVNGFTTSSIRELPPRTYGRLRREADGRLVLRSRRFLVFPEKSLALAPGQHAIGKGLVSPALIALPDGDAGASHTVLFRLLPRFRDHEQDAARILGVDTIRDISIARGFRETVQWTRSVVADERAAAHDARS